MGRSGLEAKTVVVTGAGSGIGRALALKLAKAGADVWALDIDAAAVASLAEEAAKFGQEIQARHADVTDRESLNKVKDELLQSRRDLDFWINNAGIARIGDFNEAAPDDFEKVVHVNLSGVVNGTRVALAAMESAGKGRIVNMGSIAGHLPAPYMTAYVAAKHAVVGFTRSLTAELRLKGSPVSMMLVSPGFVDTRIISKGEALGFPEWLSFLLSTPDAVAEEIVRALPSRREELYPTMNGKLMKSMYSLMPKSTVRSSRILLTKSWKDLVLNRYSR